MANEIKSARFLDGTEKSKQEVEEQLLNDAGASETTTEPEVIKTTPEASETTTEAPESTTTKAPVTTDSVDMSSQPEPVKYEDDGVLSFLGEKLGRQIASYDDLIEVRKEEVSLPEDVQAFWDYKRETNRNLGDYIESQRDFNSMNHDDLIRSYYNETMAGLDSDDITYQMKSKFGYDELADEDEIRRATIAKKQEAAKAAEYFNEKKGKYKLPLESSESFIPEDEKENYNAYKQYKATSTSQQEEAMKRSNYFQEKTNELFNDKFEGFKLKIGEEEVSYNPGDLSKLKGQDINSFGSKHLDDKGYIKDAEAYHLALTIANDPGAFANYFYEQGQASTVTNLEKEGKNVDMQLRQGNQHKTKGGATSRYLGGSGSKKLTIKV
jgi:hypothetical protein